MVKYIFNTEAEAEQYNTDCVIAHGHHGSTSRWDSVQKHPTLEKYAISKGSVVAQNAELVEELPSDWNEEIDF
jgi:hypothetical protein